MHCRAIPCPLLNGIAVTWGGWGSVPDTLQTQCYKQWDGLSRSQAVVLNSHTLTLLLYSTLLYSTNMHKHKYTHPHTEKYPHMRTHSRSLRSTGAWEAQQCSAVVNCEPQGSGALELWSGSQKPHRQESRRHKMAASRTMQKLGANKSSVNIHSFANYLKIFCVWEKSFRNKKNVGIHKCLFIHIFGVSHY